jgi:transposase-like protein
MENLNINDNHKILAIKALDMSKNIKEAANLLGINPRTLTSWIKQFDIYFDSNKMVIKND